VLSSTTATTTAAITAVTVTPAVTAANKPYDGTTSAALSTCTLTGVLGTDVVTCTGTATFDTAVVGAGKTVTVSGLTLGGAANANYVLSSTTATATAAITAVTVTPAVTAANKPYDGTTSAALSTCTLTGVLGTDVVTCTGTATFDTAVVGTGKTVTVSGLTLGGAAAANYVLSSTTATTTAAITAVTVTPAVTVANKPYDGTTSAALSTCTLTGVLGTDVVTCSGTPTFDTAVVGTGKTVTVSGLTLGGAAAANYVLSSTTATTTASITAVTVTATVTVANKPYDGTTSATLSTCTLTGVVGTDVVTCSGTASFDTATVGTGKTVTVSGLTLSGAAAANYVLSSTTATTTASITAVAVTATVTAANKPYDGTIVATLTSCTITGLVNGDVVNCTGPAAFDTATVGTGKIVTAALTLTGEAAVNYGLTSSTATTTAAITARTLAPRITVANKSYDRTTDAVLTACTVAESITVAWDLNPSQEIVLGYRVRVGTAPGVFTETFDVGNQTSFIYQGAVDGQEYFFAVAAYNAAGVGPESEVFGFSQPSGLVNGDVVGCTGTAAFDTASAGTAKTVTVSGLTLTGASAANYTLASPTATATAVISPLTVTAIVSVGNKAYDRTSSATVTSCTLMGALSGDVVGCTGTADFDTITVGPDNLVTVSDLTITGDAAENYVLTSTRARVTAAITPAVVTATVTAADKVYDGATSTTLLSCTVSGILTGDTVGCTGTATFSSASVGAGRVVTVTNLILIGAAAQNYTLSSTTATTTASITAATVTPVVTVANKPFDGTVVGSLAQCSVGDTASAGLVAAYGFDEGAGTTVTDGSNHGNAGTIINAEWTADGRNGGALLFNGNGRVTIPDAASLHLTNGMTLEAWIKPTVIDDNWRDVIYKGDDNFYLEATSSTRSGAAIGAISSIGDIEVHAPSALAVNTWSHLAATFDGAVVRLYVNGDEVANGARTELLQVSTHPLEIGGDILYGQHFQGIIDGIKRSGIT
jgi:hypothetical protein